MSATSRIGFWSSLTAFVVLAMVALHHSVPARRRIWTQCAVVLAVMYAVMVGNGLVDPIILRIST
jgi:hypothetical protein